MSLKENDTVEEPFTDGDVRWSIYNGVVVDEKKVVEPSAEWEEWNLRTNHIQEWFIRCSWKNKHFFLETVCKATDGCFVVGTVLKCLNLMSAKDVMESFASNRTEFAYDIIPEDDDRALETEDLKNVMRKDLCWFTGLKPSRQVSVILRLLRIGGGGLIYTIYKYLINLYEERQKKYIEGSMTAVTEIKTKTSEKNVAGEEIQQKQTDRSRSSVSKEKTRSSSGDFTGSKGNSLSSFTSKKLESLAKREAELFNYKKAKGIVNESNGTSKGSKKIVGVIRETVDYLQIMPIYLNRRIMSHVDEKILSGYKKVGKYWGKMIDESINEKSGRRAINAKINKIIGTKPESRRRIRRRWQSREGDEEEMKGEEESQTEDNDEWIKKASDSEKKDFLKRNRLNEKDLLNRMKTYEKIFSKKFKFMKLDKSGFNDRCCCWNEKVNIMACSTASNAVYFYSMRTGARLDFTVFGFDSQITCLYMEPSGSHVFVGCTDGTLVSKIARKNQINARFQGNSCAISFLFSTTTHLLSSSSDQVIRYYQLWSGICLFCLDLNQEYSITRILMTTNYSSSYLAVGTQEGFLILLDGIRKALVRKSKLHDGEITSLNQVGSILMTASEDGKIRIWDIEQLESNLKAITCYYEFDTPGLISSLFIHSNQMIVGCVNGTIKIISFPNGKILRTLKITSRIPVIGLAVSEDRFTLKVIIWHEEGIEMRVFSLIKLFFYLPNGKSIKKLNRECREKTVRENDIGLPSIEPTCSSAEEISRSIVHFTA